MGRWLTPDTTQFTETLVERTIVLPGSLFEYVSGALHELTKTYRWESQGDATPEETSAFFNDMWDEYIMSDFRNVGMIAAFVRPTIPQFWYAMNGQVLAQADYPELTDQVPATWKSGGNITLPNLSGGHSLVHQGSQFGFNAGAAGTIGGAATHTLTTAQMPNHTHGYDRPSTPVTLQAGAGIGISLIVPDLTNSTGSGQPHNNMPPYLAVKWAIYAGR